MPTKQIKTLTTMNLEYFKMALRSKKCYADTDLDGGYFVASPNYEISIECETIKKPDCSSFMNRLGEFEDTGDTVIIVNDFTVKDEDDKCIEVLKDDECLELLTEIINRTI